MKMSREEFKRAFNEAFKYVVATGIYSMEIANQIGYGENTDAMDMPKEMADAVEKFGGGCCFHHSWRLIYELQKRGIEAYWACVPEPTEGRVDQKCVVVYKDSNGERLVADVVEDIKANVKIEEYVVGGCRQKYSEIDNSRISINEMVKKSDSPAAEGYITIYPKPAYGQTFLEYYRGKFEKITMADIQK